jgi:hypothetical protein
MRFRPNVPRHPIALPPTTSGDPSVLAFSLAKAGSSLMFDILQALSREAGLRYFSAEDTLFADNVSANRRAVDIGPVFPSAGYCFGGFRHFPAYPIPILNASKVAFLVRDPRDMIVSLYFSMTRSHVLPGTNDMEGAHNDLLEARRNLSTQSIDDFARTSAPIQYTRMFEGYIAQGFLWRSNVATYRYEDVIFNKEAWIDDLCDWYGWDVPQEQRQAIARRFDVRPESERPDEHVRQVTPGNYRKHLSENTIRVMNGTFEEYMRIFGYEA